MGGTGFNPLFALQRHSPTPSLALWPLALKTAVTLQNSEGHTRGSLWSSQEMRRIGLLEAGKDHASLGYTASKGAQSARVGNLPQARQTQHHSSWPPASL